MFCEEGDSRSVVDPRNLLKILKTDLVCCGESVCNRKEVFCACFLDKARGKEGIIVGYKNLQ